MDRLPNGPELWAEILKCCPPGAFIAGGAVRDYLLGVEPKDIDVFASTDTLVPNAPWQTEVFRRIDIPEDRRAEYEAMTEVDVVQRGRIAGWTVDLVYGWYEKEFSAPKVVETFDFGLARCWWDGELHDTPEAAADRNNRTVTLLIKDRPFRAQQRFDRFNARMGGDWTYAA